MLLHRAAVIVQHEGVLLVRTADLRLELAALDRRRQFNLARSQPPQHNRRYREVDGVADVQLAVFIAAAAVEYHQPLGVRVASQFVQQPFLRDEVVVGRHRHGGCERCDDQHTARRIRKNNRTRAPRCHWQPSDCCLFLTLFTPPHCAPRTPSNYCTSTASS